MNQKKLSKPVWIFDEVPFLVGISTSIFFVFRVLLENKKKKNNCARWEYARTKWYTSLRVIQPIEYIREPGINKQCQPGNYRTSVTRTSRGRGGLGTRWPTRARSPSTGMYTRGVPWPRSPRPPNLSHGSVPSQACRKKKKADSTARYKYIRIVVDRVKPPCGRRVTALVTAIRDRR